MILKHLRDNDPEDNYNIIRMKEGFMFRNHLFISFELLSINLFEFIKENDFEGLSMGLIRRFAIQILYALQYISKEKIVHCDLKPENIVLKDKYKSGLKIIDFGSSCFNDKRVYTYIQSRFYRAPEIVMGIPYSHAIDMWSFGCILAELFCGFPLFPGENEKESIAYQMELLNVPPIDVIAQGTRSHLFFEETGKPKLEPNSRGKIRTPGKKNLAYLIDCDDKVFLDFLTKCLEWDPQKRLTPEQALSHEWILEGLPPQILLHHIRLHDIEMETIPSRIRKTLDQYQNNPENQIQFELTDEER